MPGVVVTTAVRSGPATRATSPSSTFFLVGQTERGATDKAILVSSMSDYVLACGDYVAYGTTYNTLRTFFEEGGTRAYVSRVVGPSATVGSLTLDDSEDDPTITISAAGAGDWSNRIDVGVVAGVQANTFNIKVYFDDSLVYQTGDQASPSLAVDAINNSAVAALYVTAEDEGSLAAAPNNNPTVAAAAALTAGDDDRGNILAEHYSAALDNFGVDLGAGCVAIPDVLLNDSGVTDDIVEELIAHGVTNKRIVIGSFAQGSTASGVAAEAPTYTALADSEYLALYWPWVKVQTDEGFFTIPPHGYVAGKRSLAHNSTGSHMPGAGSLSRATWLTGVETPVTAAEADTLDSAKVNALRVIQRAVRVYGARAATDDTLNWRYITYRDFLNDLSVRCELALEDILFSPIDGRRALFGQIESRLIAILEPLRTAGALYEAIDEDGNLIDPGYSVEVSDAINPLTSLSDGLITAKVGVRISAVGDRITLTITKSNLTATVV